MFEEFRITNPNKSVWSKNPNLDKLMSFEDDPYGNFEPDYWDMSYELVWYLDPRVNPTTDKVWAIKRLPINVEVKGIKEMGYVMPIMNIEYNDDLPDLGINIDECYPAYWDLHKECAWQLDPIYSPYDTIWVIKFSPAYRKVKDWKWYGIITPSYHIEYNPDLPKMEYNLDYLITKHDFTYEHIWMLDNKHLKNGEDEIWAFKIKVTNDVQGAKIINYISPNLNIEYNLELPKMNYLPNYVIPWHDLDYEHVWYMDDEYQTWVLKISTIDDVVGTKELTIPMPAVVFISYHESNAEENWQRVLEKAPNALRVNGVTGIFNAHKAAAKLAKTDMFYVVDGDAYLTDDFEFDFQPSLHNRDCTHIWQAKNPINGLVYGYGGVKLFSRKVMMSAKHWETLDLSTTVINKLKIIDKVSNITAFDTDPMSVWRSTFRECVKLCYNVLENPKDKESKSRLKIWLKGNKLHKLNQYSKSAAQYAIDWFNNNKHDYDLIKNVNDRDWLEEKFKTTCQNLKTQELKK